MSNTLFPGSIDSPTNPIASNGLNSPDHALQHGFENDAIVAIETFIGVTGSAVNGTIQFVLSGITSSDKAVGLAAIQTLTNKTLTAPVINIGSDATGDLYYRNGSGLFTRLVIGSTNQILSVSAGGLPNWVANPAAAVSSTTVNGTVQIAATADITAGTSTGTTGAILVIPASAVGAPGNNKIVQYNSSGQLPAVDGSLLTNLPAQPSFQIIAGDTTASQIQKIGVTGAITGVSTSNPMYIGIGQSTIGIIKQYTVDTGTKQITYSGVSVAVNFSAAPTNVVYPILVGTEIFWGLSNSSGTFFMTQCVASTLASTATTTVSGTAPSGGNTNAYPGFSDGTNLYIYANGSAGVVNKYSVSGTTVTFVSSITYTNFSGTDSAWCDGTNVYQYDGSTLRKWPLAGGAATIASTAQRLSGLNSLIGNSAVGVVQSGSYLLVCAANPLTNGVNIFCTPITKP